MCSRIHKSSLSKARLNTIAFPVAAATFPFMLDPHAGCYSAFQMAGTRIRILASGDIF